MRRPAPRTMIAAAAVLLVGVVGFQPACTTSGGKKATSVPTNTPAAANATWTPFPTDTETHTITLTRTRSLTFTRTITNTPSITPTRSETRTFTETFTPSDTPTPCLTPAGNVVSVTVDCWNSSGCSICGSTALYTCITGASNCTFTDPCPGGQTAVELIASVYGTSCITGSIAASCNGTAIGSASVAYACICNSCTTWCIAGTYYGGGFPGWVSGGTNTLTLTPSSSSVCVSHVSLQVGCQ